MRLESARSLKAEILGRSDLRRVATVRSLPAVARAVAAPALCQQAPPSAFALGLQGRGGRWRLALRVQRADPGLDALVEAVRRQAAGELDVRVVGRVVRQAPWHRRRNRPLRIGGSVGHVAVTAGTLGGFVTRPGGAADTARVLSNNHVLANENRGRPGDAVLQPGPADGGQRRRDRVGSLARFVRLRPSGNRVDAAVADLDGGIEYYYDWLEGLGAIAGVRHEPLDAGERVFKLGRTTGLTEGRVSAIEVDALQVGFETGDRLFDSQIEIAPAGGRPFSLGGDSGSLIVDGRRRAVGLLFAGNDADATYANPIGDVLAALRVELLR